MGLNARVQGTAAPGPKLAAVTEGQRRKLRRFGRQQAVVFEGEAHVTQFVYHEANLVADPK